MSKCTDGIALVSGGLDSVTMLHFVAKVLNRKPTVLLFNYKQRSLKELEFAKYHAELLGLPSVEVDLDLPEPQWVESDQFNTYIPVRNLVFLSYAASYAEGLGAHMIYTGFHQYQDMFWDTTSEFVKNLNAVLRLNDRFEISIFSPLFDLSKWEIITTGLNLKVDYAKTWSCYANQDLACGTCPICKVRIKTFGLLGMKDPLEYVKLE